MTSRAIWNLALLAGLLAAPAAFWAIPPAAVESGPAICPYKIVLGVECPGCGMTRAFSHAAHGNLAAAWRYNRMVVVAVPLVAWLWGILTLKQLRLVRRWARPATPPPLPVLPARADIRASATRQTS